MAHQKYHGANTVLFYLQINHRQNVIKKIKIHRIDGEDVRLMLWDTAGQEEFDAITAAYYRGAHACVLAFSATDRDSFDAIPSWKLKVRPCSLFFYSFDSYKKSFNLSRYSKGF